MNGTVAASLLFLAGTCLVATAAPRQDEAEFLRRELQGPELWFVQQLDRLVEENNRRKIEEHFAQFRVGAEGAFFKIEGLYLENVGDLESTWLSRLDVLARGLNETEKTKQWTRRVDYVVTLKDPKDREDRRQAMNDLANADAIRGQIAKGSVDLLRVKQSNEALDRARVIFERIKDEQNLAYVHLLLALNASTEKNEQKLNDEIVASKDYWLRSGLSIESEQYRWMLEQLREMQKKNAPATPPPAPAEPPADTGKDKPKEPQNDDWTKTPFKLKEDLKIGKLPTPAVADDDPRTWPDFYAKGDASKSDVTFKFPVTFKPAGHSIELIRNADNYKLDPYGDKSGAERLQIGPGKIATVTVRTNPKDLGSPGYVFQVTLANNEEMFGLNVPMAPAKGYVFVRYRTACKLEGTVEGKKWTIIDDNDSGQFGDIVQRYDEYAGTDPASLLSLPDALFIDKLDKPIPFSEYMVVGDNIYRFRIDAATYNLESQTAAGGKGWIKLEWAGNAKPESVIVVGLEDRRNCAYDLVHQEKTPVVAGRYRLAYGVLSAGKGEKAARCLILPGKSEMIDVQDGLEKPLQLGAPFTIDFAKSGQKDEVTVVGTSVRVLGRGKEVYSRFNEPILPTVAARTKEGKTLERGKAMEKPAVEDYNKGRGSIAFPKTFGVKKEGKEYVQFQLTLKGNPLFGNIESAWK